MPRLGVSRGGRHERERRHACQCLSQHGASPNVVFVDWKCAQVSKIPMPTSAPPINICNETGRGPRVGERCFRLSRWSPSAASTPERQGSPALSAGGEDRVGRGRLWRREPPQCRKYGPRQGDFWRDSTCAFGEEWGAGAPHAAPRGHFDTDRQQ